MVCPNCHSTDIITVQGENFCISCGQVVPTSAETKTAPTIEDLAKVQAKVAGSDEMAVLVGKSKKKKDTQPAEPLAPKVRGLGPKLRAGEVTVKVTPGADKAAAAEAQAELAQAVAKAMAPAAAPEDTAPAAAPADEPVIKTSAHTKANSQSTKTSPLISKFAPSPATPAMDISAEAVADAGTGDEQSPAEPAATDKKTSITVAATTAAGQTKRRKPGRPKAGRLDVPVAAATTSTATTTPADGDGAAASPGTTATSSGPEPASSPTPPPAPPVAAAPKQPRAMSDLRPAGRPRPAGRSKAAPTPVASAATASTNHTAGQPAAPDSPATVSSPAPKPAGPPTPAVTPFLIKTSLHERVRPTNLFWSLLPAAFLALAIGGLTLALLHHNVQQVTAIARQAGWALWGEGLLLLALYYLSHSVVNAAIIMGIARREANRPIIAARQFGTAINTWLHRLILDACLALLQLIVISGLILLLVTGSTHWPLPPLAQTIVLFAGFLTLSYLLAGLALTQGLARVGLTISPVSIGRAISLGWQLFWRHFELVGFRAFALVIEALMLIPGLAAAFALYFLVPAAWNWAAVLGITLIATLTGALTGAGTAGWWEAAYRHLIGRQYPAKAGKLLGGRPAERAHPLSLSSLLLFVAILVGLAIAWPWLGSHIS